MRWLLTPIVALLLAAPAGAAPLAPIEVGESSRFELAGERILMWVGETGTLSVREPGGARRVLYRARQFKEQQSLITDVAARGSQLAILTEGYDAVGEGGQEWSSLRTGPFDGPYDVVAGREGGGASVGPIAIAHANAGLVVASQDGDNRLSLELRPAGGGPAVRLGAGARGLAVNGRYAATRTFDRAAVYDLETRTRIAQVRADSDPASQPAPVGVTASGALLHTDTAGRLLSAGTVRMRGVEDIVAVVGERAYVVRRVATTPYHSLDRLWSLDLASGEARPLTAALETAQFHTDGARLLYATPGCVAYGALPVEAPQTTPACPRERLSFDVNEEQRRPRVRMWVSCPGASGDEPCTGTARLTAKARRGGGRVTLGTWRFSAAGGSRATRVLKVRLRRAAPTRRRGRTRHVARLRVSGSGGTRITRRMVLLR
jgi:hypothetical protein